MNFAAWNVRGLSDPIKGADVRKICAENNVSLVGLLETRVNHSNEASIQTIINSRWDFFINSRARKMIWLGWDPRVWRIQILEEHTQFLHCFCMNIRLNIGFFVTFVYGDEL